MLLSSFLEDLSGEILKIYEQIDQKVATFQEMTGIKCIPGCGQCCTSKKVRVTSLEFILLARYIFQHGEADVWWQYLLEKNDGICAFFQPDLFKAPNGHCKIYPWRAATCRLYGFAVKADKYGSLEPITCHFLKNDFYNAIKDLCRKNLADLLPSYDYFMIQIASLDPVLGTIPLPINQAIAKSLEKYALAHQINSSAGFFIPLNSALQNNYKEDGMGVSSRSEN